MEKLIEEQGCPQAFIASSLPVLEGAVRAIRDRLGAVPPEINIGTFDEHPMLGFLANNVWSMQQDENAGRKSVRNDVKRDRRKTSQKNSQSRNEIN